MSRRRGFAAVVAASAAMMLAAVPAQADDKPAVDKSWLAQVRQATVAFHDLDAATGADYEAFLPCIDHAELGGMGQHYVNWQLVDGTPDPAHPEALVYEPRPDGSYRLVGVEYVVPMSAWTGEDPPELYGAEFHEVTSLGIWALHAWIWRGNPSGAFADFNPAVRACG